MRNVRATNRKYIGAMNMVKKGLNVGIDIDSTLYDNVQPLINKYNEEFDTRLTTANIKGWGIEEYLKKWNADRIKQEFVNVEYTGPPFDNSREVIELLVKNLHTIYFVTHTYDGGQVRQKFDWLHEQFSGIPYSVLFVSMDHRTKTFDWIDIVIDDNPNTISTAVDNDKRVLCIDQPWNRHLNAFEGGFLRVKNWAHVRNILYAMEVI